MYLKVLSISYSASVTVGAQSLSKVGAEVPWVPVVPVWMDLEARVLQIKSCSTGK